MRKHLFLSALWVLMLCGITACDSGSEGTETVEAAPESPNRFEVAGIDNQNDVTKFLVDLQSAVSANDRAAIAQMVTYPFSLYQNGKATKQYADASAFSADYDILFPQAVKEAIKAAKIDDLFVNAKGIMIGNGQIWLGHDGERLKIIGINPTP